MAGRTAATSSRMTRWAAPSSGVRLLLTMMTRAPLRAARAGSSLAGTTSRDVPATSITSHVRASVSA